MSEKCDVEGASKVKERRGKGGGPPSTRTPTTSNSNVRASCIPHICIHVAATLALVVGEPPGHLGTGTASPACMLTRAPARDHAPATTSHGHGGSYHGVAPRGTGTPLLEVGVPCAACGANCRACPTAGTVDRAPCGGGGTFQIPDQVPDSQVPGAPQQGPLLHGTPRPVCTAVRASPHPKDYLLLQPRLQCGGGQLAVVLVLQWGRAGRGGAASR